MPAEPETVAAWMEQLSDFARPMIERIYKIIRKAAPQLEEGIRWSSPTFIGRGLVCSFAAFQKHVTLVFWRGAELNDTTGLLTHGQGRSAMRSAKFTSLDQIDDKVIRTWVTAAVALDKDPAKPKPKPQKRPEAAVPKVLAAALSRNPKARGAFDAMPPSHRREYCEWIAEAKQEATVQRRVEKTIEKLSAGEGLHDKYRP
ncbi:MAG TPA: YdeI/OmpD-associated family protein [Verrucomicrobiales bacterium]|nr:YdeI/OmpD-associated family protein [Verrucomicrobiales bacterium]